MDKSEKTYNKSSENVSFAEHKILKEKYESLMIEHESLIKTLEVLETTHGFTVDDLVTKQREALERKEVIEKWENKFGEMQKKLEFVEKNIEYIMSMDDETEMNGVDSGSARPAERPNVKNNVSKEDAMAISDDDEENQRLSNSSHQDHFIL
ncbi:hypothetical protein ISN45_Aa07g017810 [Arabidopsis thaliana x Arabidopsis arenosa]|uniref:Uncharacterized protein n=1 Tax=Arabidopsis thaliana x Arabidopsis arenosa TaxID=1240361 RepID=A0A8T1Y3M0_9BRAS|nr:hypothetical protein ISN45_Aa07g017810 [Arabidopsis thaliana x Arabidopsis arenosa]